MSPKELIKQLEQFCKKHPDLADVTVRTALQAIDTDKLLVVDIDSVSYCGSIDGDFPCLNGSFSITEDI